MFVRLTSMLLAICLSGCAGSGAPLSPLRSADDSARAVRPLRNTDFTVIYAFHGQPNDGSFPLGELLLDSSGDVYGTTFKGGSADVGTVYELRPSGSTYTEEILYQFSISAQYGFAPFAGPVRGPNGSLLLTASQGGPNGAGTVIQLISNGGSYSVNALPMQSTGFSFPGAEFLRLGGRYYATAQNGGPGGYGGVFEVTGAASKVRATYAFTGGSDGQTPFGSLVADSTGALYGTTGYGGTGGLGTVYKIAPSGRSVSESILWSFNGNNGDSPDSNLLLDQNGDIYGTTEYGGSDDGGVLFKLSPNGSTYSETVLHNFGIGPDGANPIGGLALRGNRLFGTTVFGGNPACTSGCGTIFEITTAGKDYRIRHEFEGADGAWPRSTLVAHAGAFYAVTPYGSPYSQGSGVVFRFVP